VSFAERRVPQRVNARLASSVPGAQDVHGACRKRCVDRTLSGWPARGRSRAVSRVSCADEAALPDAAAAAAGICERQVLASQQRLQALVARFSDELADARTVGDAREAAYSRDKAARSQRVRDKAAASEAARCVSADDDALAAVGEFLTVLFAALVT